MSRVVFNDAGLFVVYAEKSNRVMTGHSSNTVPKIYSKGCATRIANETNQTQSKELFERDGEWKVRPIIIKIVPDLSPKFKEQD